MLPAVMWLTLNKSTSILLPALRQAKQAAYASSCKNNLKQIAVWGITYANDWDEVLPTDGGTWGGCGAGGYTDLSVTTWLEKCPFMKQVSAGTALHCPQASSSIQPRDGGWTYTWSDFSLIWYLGSTKITGWTATPSPPKLVHLTDKKHANQQPVDIS